MDNWTVSIFYQDGYVKTGIVRPLYEIGDSIMTLTVEVADSGMDHGWITEIVAK